MCSAREFAAGTRVSDTRISLYGFRLVREV